MQEIRKKNEIYSIKNKETIRDEYHCRIMIIYILEIMN